MYVVTGDEMHRIDRYTMDEIGLSGEALMENAGQAFCRQLIPSLKRDDKIAIMIGTGNNGGDGFVIGRILCETGYEVDVFLVPPEEKISGDALQHKRVFENSGYGWTPYVEVQQQMDEKIHTYSVIIDALLGTGLKGIPRSPYKEVIELLNRTKGRIISVDIPSGVPAKEGENVVVAVEADETFTFQAPKISRFLYPAAFYYGNVHVLDIGIPKKAVTAISGARKVITDHRVGDSLPKRKPNAHKGSAGKALIIGGSKSMTGASVLTTKACLRSGAGLVTLAVPDVIHPIVSQKTTEAMFHSLASANGEISSMNFSEELSILHFDGIAIGPGMGRSNEHNLFNSFQHYEGYLVIDADGLYHLSKELSLWKGGRPGGPTMITPHPGEMARLTGVSIDELENRRFEISKEFAMTYQMFVVLKGPYTIVTAPNGEQWVNQTGNASLAKGGSGDVLTGIIIGFLLQHENSLEALCNAVFIHGKTADEMVKDFDILSVTAMDLVERLPRVLQATRYHS